MSLASVNAGLDGDCLRPACLPRPRASSPMICYDCAAVGRTSTAVAVCVGCGAAACQDHAVVVPRYLTRTAAINRVQTVEVPTRILHCGFVRRPLTRRPDHRAAPLGDCTQRSPTRSRLSSKAAEFSGADSRSRSHPTGRRPYRYASTRRDAIAVFGASSRGHSGVAVSRRRSAQVVQVPLRSCAAHADLIGNFPPAMAVPTTPRVGRWGDGGGVERTPRLRLRACSRGAQLPRHPHPAEDDKSGRQNTDRHKGGGE